MSNNLLQIKVSEFQLKELELFRIKSCWAESHEQNRIINCDFETTGIFTAAIIISNSTNGLVVDNHIFNIFGGIILDNCSQMTFTNNNITLCGYGINIANSDNMNFNLNNVDQTWFNEGIELDNCEDLTFTDNTVSEGSMVGVIFDGCNRITLNDNINYG